MYLQSLVELETEVPVEVSREVPNDVRAELYVLVDKVWAAVKLFMLEDAPEVWPDSPVHCPASLDKMMDQLEING